MNSRFFLNIVVGESTAVFELFAGKDKTLLIGWDTLLVLNLALDVIDSITRFDLERDGLAGN